MLSLFQKLIQVLDDSPRIQYASRFFFGSNVRVLEIGPFDQLKRWFYLKKMHEKTKQNTQKQENSQIKTELFPLCVFCYSVQDVLLWQIRSSF